MPKQAQQSKEKKNKQPVPTSGFSTRLTSFLIFVVDVKQGLPRYVRVTKILARTGARGGIQQVRVEFVEDDSRTMTRNVIVFYLVFSLR